jgi:hypothetical protein
MTKKQLLTRFRLGFLKVRDKQTNALYISTGALATKVMQIKVNIIMMFFIVPIPLLILLPWGFPFKVVFGILLYLFESITLFMIGRLLISEKDLKDVIEEKIDQE